jgi:hypothetical protein
LVVLEGPTSLLASRKHECSEAELDRQRQAWHEVVPPRVRTYYLDAALSLEEAVQETSAALERLTVTEPTT